ncbi:extracellular solute-binding protein [Galbitalea sp. SE-J8]|uniref:extracellular solute-binding protein n=1 Tax=Galbitalea sp. SE-J8 TaxID=3054952 RepID=UPI00259CC097|nr:extracellular solute-binding protein [Galbitalea sp. SE-J8]MDM4763562.1 extracellular solute-binding protein [Galbitalea sp. SE-J8]
MPTIRPKTRGLIAASAVAAVATVLSGCAASPATDAAVDEITVWTGLPYDSFQKPNKAAFDACAATTGVKAKLEDFPPGDLTAKVIQAATSGDLPDLLYLEGTDLSRVAETGVLNPLSDFDLDASDYYPIVEDMGSYDGELYGIAPGVNTVGVFYNKDIFDAAGVAVPTTFAELRAAAKTLTTPDIQGFALSADSGTGPYVFLPFLLSAGGDPAELDSPAAVEALQLWKGLLDDGSTSASATTIGWDAQDAFRADKAAMVMSGSWLFSEGLGMNMGVFPVPTPDGTGTPVSPIGGELWTIPTTDDAHQAAAAKVLACITDDKNSLAMAMASHRTPSKTTIADAYLDANPDEAALIDLIDGAYLRDPEKTGDQNERIATAVQDALANGTDPATALAKVAGD